MPTMLEQKLGGKKENQLKWTLFADAWLSPISPELRFCGQEKVGSS